MLLITILISGCSNYQLVKPINRNSAKKEIAVEKPKPKKEKKSASWYKIGSWFGADDKDEEQPTRLAFDTKPKKDAWDDPINVDLKPRTNNASQRSRYSEWRGSVARNRPPSTIAEDLLSNNSIHGAKDIVWGPDAQIKNTPELPALIVTKEPPPNVIYRRGSHDTVLSENTATAIRQDPLRTHKMETAVTHKAREIEVELGQADKKIDTSTRKFDTLRNKNRAETSEYYSLIATINSALQTGTTPGNPILVDRWNAAQDKLNQLSKTSSLTNNLAVDLSYQASKTTFILESIKAAFELSGAVDSDHVKLTELEDEVTQYITDLNRMIVKVNAELNRLATLLRTERENMQTLSLGISKGELYGANIKNTVFRKRSIETPEQRELLSQRKPLVIIKFNKPGVNYDKPLYSAISKALGKRPNAKFDLVAVSPRFKNPAKESMRLTEARKDGEAVLNSLTKMGMPASRINLSSEIRPAAKSSEVHIYIK